MKSEDFVDASAYIRTLEKRMLSHSGISRIVEAPNVADAFRQISQNSEYDFTSLKRVEDYEDALRNGLKKAYDLMYKLSPHREVIDIPASKYNFHNLKVVLKSKYTDKKMEHLYSDITDLDASQLEGFIFTGEEKQKLPEYMKKSIRDIETAFAESKDPQTIDILADKLMFEYMLELCERIQNDFITEYVRLSIDFYNVKTLMRVKNMSKGSRFLGESMIAGGLTDTRYFLEHYDKSPEEISSVFYYKYFSDVIKNGMESHGKTGNFSNLEKLFDDYLIDYTRKSKYLAFGAELPFVYILSKENEIRQIRILITGKKNEMRAEDLRERLRDNYA